MADTSRVVTPEEIQVVTDKLGPAFDSLTEEECQVFMLVLEGASEGGEVSGFAQGLNLGMETLGALSASSGSSDSAVAGEAQALSWIRKKCRSSIVCCPKW